MIGGRIGATGPDRGRGGSRRGERGADTAPSPLRTLGPEPPARPEPRGVRGRGREAGSGPARLRRALLAPARDQVGSVAGRGGFYVSLSLPPLPLYLWKLKHRFQLPLTVGLPLNPWPEGRDR